MVLACLGFWDPPRFVGVCAYAPFRFSLGHLVYQTASVTNERYWTHMFAGRILCARYVRHVYSLSVFFVGMHSVGPAPAYIRGCHSTRYWLCCVCWLLLLLLFFLGVFSSVVHIGLGVVSTGWRFADWMCTYAVTVLSQRRR